MSTRFDADYVKTTFSNRVAPALNGTNLNNNENGTKNAIDRIAQLSSEMDQIDSIVRNGLHPVGIWNASATYAIGDLVAYDDKSYVCYVANTNKVPTNASYWQPCFDIMGARVLGELLELNVPSGDEIIYDGGTADA